MRLRSFISKRCSLPFCSAWRTLFSSSRNADPVVVVEILDYLKGPTPSNVISPQHLSVQSGRVNLVAAAAQFVYPRPEKQIGVNDQLTQFIQLLLVLVRDFSPPPR